MSNPPKKALGRGLDALIPQVEKPTAAAVVPEPADAQVAIDSIRPSRYQPRTEFDPEKLAELAASVKAQGILQPLLVRSRAAGGYELIAGERRLRAAKLAGLLKVPVVVREVDDRTAFELALIENLQREDLDPLEEAESFRRALGEFGYTQEELSKKVGKDRATVANSLRLLNLSDEFKDDLREGRMTPGHARAILMAGSETLMQSIRDAVVGQGISVREAERRAQSGSKKTGKSPKAQPKPADPNLRELEEQLVRDLGTKVKIVSSGKGGKIEISFFSGDDLDRLYRRITR
jgi:ParB family chromosome partitioning protein